MANGSSMVSQQAIFHTVPAWNLHLTLAAGIGRTTGNSLPLAIPEQAVTEFKKDYISALH